MPRLPRRITDYGPTALLLDWESKMDPEINRSVHAYAAALRLHPAVSECVPAYASLLVSFLPDKTSAYALREFVFSMEQPEEATSKTFQHDLPVCYDDRLAPDLKEVVGLLKTNRTTLIKRHLAPIYLVYQVGFLPGFGFFGQTDERLAVPRRDSPRSSVPAGSVGLAGRQTGIYPSASPGGWRLIGNCPVPLLRSGEDVSRLRPGDTVRFHAISYDEFLRFDPNTTPWPLR